MCVYIYIYISVRTRHKTVTESCEREVKYNKKCVYQSQASNTIPKTISTKLRSTVSNTTSIRQFESCRPGARVEMSSWSGWILYVEMLCWSSRTGRSVAPQQLDRTKGRPRASGQVEILSWTIRTGRNVGPEQQDRSKCRPGGAEQVEMSSGSSRTSRNVVLEKQDKSRCRPRATG